MKRVFLSLLLPCFFCIVYGQKICRTYRDVSLPEVLRDLNKADESYTINFMYNELEDFRVTAQISSDSITDAILQAIGFYPVRVVRQGNYELYVECIGPPDHLLKGRIIDEHNQPMAYANIAAYSPSDTTLLSNSVSNENGMLVLQVSQQKILVRISHVGYETVWQECETGDLGTIRMRPLPHDLNDISVRGHTPFVRRGLRSIIFDPKYIAGAINAVELLFYTPGVQITNEGIALFGADAIICINSKELHMNQNEALKLLKSYPSDEVERIEITQLPGAAMSAEGYGGSINLVLKKKRYDYLGGSVSYAHTQYQEHGDDVGGSVIYNKGKVSSSLSVFSTWDNVRYRETNRLDLTDFTRKHTDNGRIKNKNVSARWQADYKFSDRLCIGTYAMYSDGDRKLNVNGIYDYDLKYVPESYFIASQTSRSEKTKNTALNAYVSKKWDKKNGMIDCNLDYYHMGMTDNRMSEANGIQTENVPEEFNYRNGIRHSVSSYSGKVDGGIGNLKIGGQYVSTCSNRKLSYYWTKDYMQWGNFSFYEKILSAYAEYNGRFNPKLCFSIGGRYEYTWTEGIIGTNISDVIHGIRYGHFFPSLLVEYKTKANHSIKWSLGSRIIRPNIINLNPDTLCIDAYHFSTGNPNLKPTTLYKATIGYTYRGILNVDFYYAYLRNRMARIFYGGYDQYIQSTWINLANEQKTGVDIFCSFTPQHWLSATLIQGVGWKSTKADEYFMHTTKGWFYTGGLMTSFFFDTKRRWSANINARYNSREKDVNKLLYAHYNIDFGVQYKLLKDRLCLNLSCLNLWASHIKGKEYLSNNTIDFNHHLNYRQFRLSLTYNWGSGLRHSRKQYSNEELKERVVNDF